MKEIKPLTASPHKTNGRRVARTEWSVDELVVKSLSTLRNYLNNPNSDPDKKAELAARIVVKLMPERVEHTHTLISLTDDVAQRLMELMGDNVPRGTSDNKVIEIVPEPSKSIGSQMLQQTPKIDVL